MDDSEIVNSLKGRIEFNLANRIGLDSRIAGTTPFWILFEPRNAGGYTLSIGRKNLPQTEGIESSPIERKATAAIRNFNIDLEAHLGTLLDEGVVSGKAKHMTGIAKVLYVEVKDKTEARGKTDDEDKIAGFDISDLAAFASFLNTLYPATPETGNAPAAAFTSSVKSRGGQMIG